MYRYQTHWKVERLDFAAEERLSLQSSNTSRPPVVEWPIRQVEGPFDNLIKRNTASTLVRSAHVSHFCMNCGRLRIRLHLPVHYSGWWSNLSVS